MYESVTYRGILERMLARVPDKLDKREGSVIFDTHSPTALELRYLYIELERVISEAYGDTASRDFLIRRCGERGITPYEAAKAVLKGKFTPADIDVTGRRFNIGSTNYIALEKIAAGEYLVQCETPGVVGNRQLGAMIPIDYIDGLETAELTEILIPGEDEEETEALRARYFGSFDEKAFGGNARDYLEKTNAIAGVGGAKVTRVWNADIRPADMIPTEAVKRWYETAKPALSGEPAKWLEAVFRAAEQKKLTTGGTVLLTIVGSDYAAASETLIKSVQQTVDPEEKAGEGYGAAPIGHIVSVESAKPHTVTIKTDITFEAGYGWDNLQSSVNAAISDYLLELRKSWADSDRLIVRVSRIETRILGIKGVVDIRGTQINGREENLILGAFEVPVFGGASA